jgi:hypothetical protein
MKDADVGMQVGDSWCGYVPRNGWKLKHRIWQYIMKWIAPKLTSRWSAVTCSAGRSPIRFLAVRVSRFNDIIKILVLCVENQTACGNFLIPSHTSGFTLTKRVTCTEWLLQNLLLNSHFNCHYRYKKWKVILFVYGYRTCSSTHVFVWFVFSRRYQAVVLSDVMHRDCSVRWASREASRSADLYGAPRLHWNDK